MDNYNNQITKKYDIMKKKKTEDIHGKEKQSVFKTRTHCFNYFSYYPTNKRTTGIVYRLGKGKLLLAILNFFFSPIFYIVDLLSVLLNNDLKWLV